MTEMTEMVLNHVFHDPEAHKNKKKRKKKINKSVSRSGTLKLGSVHPGMFKPALSKERSAAEIVGEGMENAFKLRDLTGNTPLHLAIIMV